ncbi:MAG: trypsin-like peptidase domain-containing protein [Candidatus Poribacteria bacterium]|nr:trypsin-like peptidase domain-containing protein [Candidatus Poribacteria bacterium]
MAKRKKKSKFNHKSLTYTVEILQKKFSVSCKRTRMAVLLFGVISSLFNLSFQADVHAEQDLQHAITQSRRTAIVTAVERASPAVVNISATKSVTQQTPFDAWIDEYFWGDISPPIRKRSLREVGSGVIINKDGYILTNHHVIADAEKIRVAIADGREFDAHILGFDFFSDLALLKVNTKEDLPEIKWGDSGDLLIGEWALAIGNPFGLSIGNAQPTVTVGIVSATQRSLAVDNRFYEALIQTDASVNPGNSGGALVNVHGELIGINTVIRSTSGGSQGVGFAIPANKARKVIEKITEHGCIVPPYLGVEIQSITGEMAEKLLGKEVSQKSIFSRGVLVSELEEQSPIAAAGIKRGDIISIVSGRRIKDKNDFKAIVRLLPLNQNIQCEFIRRGKKRKATFKLKTLEWEYAPQRWGLTLTQPDKKMAKKYKHRGVVISHIERGNELAEVLKKGDNIYRIGEIEIHTLEIFKIVDKQIHAPSGIQLYFERNGEQKSIFITFKRNNRWR